MILPLNVCDCPHKVVEAGSAEQSSLDGWEEGKILSEVNSLHTIILPRTYVIQGILSL